MTRFWCWSLFTLFMLLCGMQAFDLKSAWSLVFIAAAIWGAVEAER